MSKNWRQDTLEKHKEMEKNTKLFIPLGKHSKNQFHQFWKNIQLNAKDRLE